LLHLLAVIAIQPLQQRLRIPSEFLIFFPLSALINLPILSCFPFDSIPSISIRTSTNWLYRGSGCFQQW
ncbi:hypothetical protein Goshw_004443, partial [Gossypium schwendimanii]|nr:hypothetical protein [Gossypium schwendimanii]